MKKHSGELRDAFFETDLLTFAVCLLTSAFGVLMVFSATLVDVPEGGHISRDALVMAIAVGAGVIIALAISFIDYEIVLKLWFVIAGACVLLMLALFKWGVGPEGRSDVKTWLDFGGVFFQPSELLKLGFIITFTIHLELVRDDVSSIKNVLLLCLHAVVPMGLVALTGDLGSALVFAFIFVFMMFLAGVKLRYFLIGGAVVLAAVPIVWIKVFSSIQRDRFLALIYPDRYPDIIYQQLQGKRALGSGQLLGSGLFKGPFTQNGVVPESENDMVLSVVGEELGFVGCIALMLALAFIVYRIVKVGMKSNDYPGKLLCMGIAVMIGSQIAVNVGMCLMLLPCIGITLPFMSAGGSSNLCIYIGMGLVFSVYRFNKERAPTNFRVSKISTPFS